MINRRLYVAFVGILSLSLCVSACEPLRKKFTRKKKTDAIEDKSMVPVLEPEEYPAPEENPYLNYQQQYAMVKVFYKDLWRGIEDNLSNKNIKFALDQVMVHLDEMQRMLVDDKKMEVDKLKESLAYYRHTLESQELFRNKARIASDLRSFYRQLVRVCKPNVIKESLIKAIPADATAH